jgi:hypothetical protein
MRSEAQCHQGGRDVIRPERVNSVRLHRADDILDAPDRTLSLPVRAAVSHGNLTQPNPQGVAELPEMPGEFQSVVRGDPRRLTPARQDLVKRPRGAPTVFRRHGDRLYPFRKGIHSNEQVLITVVIRGERSSQVDVPTLKGPGTLPRFLERHLDRRVRPVLLTRNTILETARRVLLEALPPKPFLHCLNQLIPPNVPQLPVEIIQNLASGGDGRHINPTHRQVAGTH